MGIPQILKPVSRAARARFGTGIRRSIAAEVAGLGTSNALILSTPDQLDLALEISERLGSRAAGLYSKAAPHTPVSVTDDALEHLVSVEADCLVAIGGGSTIGLGKALALRTGLPQIVLPTTYAGSEATPILGQTQNGAKTTLTDPRAQPGIVLYDSELVATLPTDLTVASGLNAMAHAAEALYAQNRTSQTDKLAVGGLLAFVVGLRQVCASPLDLVAREETQRGAWACGRVLGRAGMGLHHKLCHMLGGAFGLPHAATHAIILPHAIAYNERAVPDLLAPIRLMLGGPSSGYALHNFAASLGAPMALRDLGLAEADLDRAAHLATQTPYPNPQPVTRNDVRTLLQAAWAGQAPAF